jgi:hypothetical protein
MRQPYFANTLIKVELSVQTVTTPAEDRQGVVLFPLPRVEASGRLTTPNVVLDTGTWFVHDERASTLPAQCPSQTSAQVLADTWVDNVSTGSVDPTNPDQVTRWCRWFVDAHPDCAVFAPFPKEPVLAALAMTRKDAWPSGTDAEAAAALTTKLPAVQGDLASLLREALDEHEKGQADEGQDDPEVTEEAS